MTHCYIHAVANLLVALECDWLSPFRFWAALSKTFSMGFLPDGCVKLNQRIEKRFLPGAPAELIVSDVHCLLKYPVFNGTFISRLQRE